MSDFACIHDLRIPHPTGSTPYRLFLVLYLFCAAISELAGKFFRLFVAISAVFRQRGRVPARVAAKNESHERSQISYHIVLNFVCLVDGQLHVC